MVTGMVRPSMVSTMVNPLASFIRRYFAQLDAVQQSHYVYANTLVFQAGDTYEFDFLAPTGAVTSDEYLTDGDTADDRSFLLFRNSDYTINASNMTLEVDGVIKVTGDLHPVDGALHHAKITFTAAARLGFMGSRYTLVDFYSGILANAVATISGVTTSNTLGLATGNVEYPAENVFGSELVTNNVFDNTAGWLDARGTATISAVSSKLRATAGSTSTFGASTALTGLTVGEAYRVAVIATSNNPAITIRIRVGTTQGLSESDILQSEGDGLVSLDGLFTATATTMYLGTINTGHDAGDYVEIDAGITARSITNAITYVNIPDAQREQYTLIDGSWIGQELWDNTPILQSNWVDDGGGSYTYNGDGSFNTMRDGVLTVGSIYLTVFSVDAITGNMKVFADIDQDVFTTTGITSATLVAGSANIQWTRGSGLSTCTLSDISVKRKIEIA